MKFFLSDEKRSIKKGSWPNKWKNLLVKRHLECHVIDDESSLLFNDVDVQISKIDTWVADFIKKKCPWEIQEKRVFFIRLHFLATLKYNLWGFLISKKKSWTNSQKGSLLCLQMSVWKQMWVKVALAFLFFKVSNKVQFESFFYKFIAKFSEKWP